MSDVTRILQSMDSGDPSDNRAAEELLPLVYDELRRLATAKMAKENPGQTLQPTALVHEAYIRLVGEGSFPWDNRGHFFAAAAEAMRRILVEKARRKNREKHGGGLQRVNFDDLDVAMTADFDSVPGYHATFDNGCAAQFHNTNHRLTIVSTCQTVTSGSEAGSWAGAQFFLNYPVTDGRTAELRVDLIGAGDVDDIALLAWDKVSPGHYILGKGPRDLYLLKLGPSGRPTYFFWETNVIKNQNVTMVLQITGKDSSAAITVRILDIDDGNAVLYERSIVDTPSSDFALPDGSRYGLRMDSDFGAPWIGDTKSVWIGVFNYSTSPPSEAEVTFDNFIGYSYFVPSITFRHLNSSQMELTWADPGAIFALQEAPAVAGPWADTTLVVTPENGIMKATVAGTSSAQFYRLRRNDW